MSNDAMGWNFDNSYARLPEHFYTKLCPIKTHAPKVVLLNYKLANELNLNLNTCSETELAQLFSGNQLPKGSEPLAQAYAGHQFGYFSILGDGRAHLIGEHVISKGKRVDIQLKGSGKTPYGRRGDGRAALGPMLREYVISEAMNALHVPTTRSLAVVTSGEPIYRETVQQGAILTRVASSHLRVGTFEYLAAQQDIKSLKQLADYALERHYPQLKETDQPYLNLIKAVMEKQISLIVAWLRIGFIHGVMNTDNMTLSGETIDYGPCAFMDGYDSQTVFSSIDHAKRYAYVNQPYIVQWNIARFAEALLPLLHKDMNQARKLAEDCVQSFNAAFQHAWLAMMQKKLGLFGEKKEDRQLIDDLLAWMQHHCADYTNTFHSLISHDIPDGKPCDSEGFHSWWQRWRKRLSQNNQPLQSSFCLMRANNPAVIPRNHKVAQALSLAENHLNFSKIQALLNVLLDPYSEKQVPTEFCLPPKPEEQIHQTFCGT